MRRADAFKYVAYCVDDSLNELSISEMPDPSDKVRLVGWQTGCETVFVAVWSYLGHRLDDDFADELATDLLFEKGWFWSGAVEPDYIL